MDKNPTPSTAPAFPALLAAAPHRLLFLVGALNVLAAMTWWALWLADLRWQLFGLPQPTVPAGWSHALTMTFQVLPAFIFGFLLTVFPRWMNQPLLSPFHYIPVGIGMLGGSALTLAGLFAMPALLHTGLLLTLAAYLYTLTHLLLMLWRDRTRCWHARSAALAVTLGCIGLLLMIIWLHRPTAALLAFASIKISVIAFLLPVYLTVCHRMLPFFASRVVVGYQPWRPLWLLGGFWLLLMLHLVLELMHAYAWLWLADLPLFALASLMLWRMWPTGPQPGLLRVLFLGLAWLPFAFALYSGQSLAMLFGGEFVLGRAPVHALTVGFFGSLLVAMVTRVTQGHAGRPLVMGTTAWFAFAVVQLAPCANPATESPTPVSPALRTQPMLASPVRV